MPAARIQALARDDLVGRDGDLNMWRSSEVRLPGLERDQRPLSRLTTNRAATMYR